MSSNNGTIFQATAAAEPPGALRIKPSRNKQDASSEWKCLQCNKNFSRKSALKVHNRKSCRKVQNSSGSVNGCLRLLTTPTAENARRPRKPRHPCTVCEKSFANKLDLVYHIRSYHPSVDVETVCPIKSTKHKNFLVCPG